MRCLKCKERVIEPGMQSEDGSFFVEPGSALETLREGNNEFVVCPYCGARNLLVVEPSESGQEKLYFLGYV